MAFTGVAIVTKIADALARITGISLAGGAAGTIGEHGSGADVELPEGCQWGPYDGVDLAEAVQVYATPTVPLSVAKAASPFLITVTNDQAAALGAQAIVGKMARLNPQTIADSGTAFIEFDTEVFDVGGVVDVATDSFIAPVAGKYMVTANAFWAESANPAGITMNAIVNGSAEFTAESVVNIVGGETHSQNIIATILDLPAAAVVKFQVFQDSGAPLDISVAEANITLAPSGAAAPAATGSLEIYVRYH